MQIGIRKGHKTPGNSSMIVWCIRVLSTTQLVIYHLQWPNSQRTLIKSAHKSPMGYRLEGMSSRWQAFERVGACSNKTHIIHINCSPWLLSSISCSAQHNNSHRNNNTWMMPWPPRVLHELLQTGPPCKKVDWGDFLTIQLLF